MLLSQPEDRAMAKSAKNVNGDAPAPSPRDRIIDALMTLAAEMRWEEITLPMIAARADVSLADLRDHYPSKGAILGGFAKRIDRIVLDGTTADMLGEPARERVLDVMLRRLDALTPYKAALKGIMAAARRDPLMLVPLNQLALNSWRYMLAAADIDTEDDLGFVRVQGAALVFARTLDVWFEDDDAGLARTMAKLDKELGMGERVMGRIEDVKRLTAPFRGFFRAAAERRASSRDEARAARGF
jgi:AcrR family transcriptional regulator